MTGKQNWSLQDQYYDGVLRDKYAKGDEKSAGDVYRRVAKGLAAVEKNGRAVWEQTFYQAMVDGFYPAGRIMSAAGTDIQATLINCFVQPVGDAVRGLSDGKPGIFPAVEEAAETMRRGGGVGYDFSDLRPAGGKVKGTHSRSSGPISYMRVFDRMCETVESAGSRRGAQMGILRCDHPDIEQFITAKDIRAQARVLRDAGLSGPELDKALQKARTLSNFNISVAITDAFMAAVQADTEFELVHKAEPDMSAHPGAYKRPDGKWVYSKVKARGLWDTIMETTYETADPGVVFIDRMNSENNLWYAERIEATNPCSEQPLPSYGCCCLGSIDLSKFVIEPFGDKASFDWKKLSSVVCVAIRMLDNVLDVTFWPLDKQREEAMNKRRIGLGFTGLGTAMAMLKIRYGDDTAVEFAAKVAREMRNTAYGASIDLAQEKGSFPLLDAAKYLNSGFAKNLPSYIREEIRTVGIRNSHLLSIAPTGTISLAFGRNVTGGIEPAFAWEYFRTSRNGDGEKITYPIQDFGYRRFVEAGGDKDNLPAFFASAQTLAAMDHVRILAAVQPFIDTAISKTINVPVDYPFEAFKDLYMQAWNLGCKGCTTYRPNDVTGAVLTVAPEAGKAPIVNLDQSDPDRRLRLDKLPTPALASLKWPGRPVMPNGNPSWTYMIEDPNARFAVFVGHAENGVKYPFECWVNGAEQPRGLGATAKLLSMDMRSQDRGWLKAKLDALEKTNGTHIRVQLPPDGREVVMASSTAAMSRLVRLRCEQLGAFENIEDTPVLNALMSPKEPKTGGEGTMSWSADVKNHATGDDFMLTLKELALPDGSRRPYSIWLAGDYPREFDGLCKLLSLDMRIVDPAWIGAKLRKLFTYAEPAGDFMAPVPGSPKGAQYPSTIAYIARLVVHRFKMLGILDEEGRPVAPMGVLAEPTKRTGNAAHTAAIVGEKCPDCSALAVFKSGGCKQCSSCLWIGACG